MLIICNGSIVDPVTHLKGKYDIDDSQFEVVTRSYDILLQILKQQNMLKYMQNRWRYTYEHPQMGDIFT